MQQAVGEVGDGYRLTFVSCLYCEVISVYRVPINDGSGELNLQEKYKWRQYAHL